MSSIKKFFSGGKKERRETHVKGYDTTDGSFHPFKEVVKSTKKKSINPISRYTSKKGEDRFRSDDDYVTGKNKSRTIDEYPPKVLKNVGDLKSTFYEGDGVLELENSVRQYQPYGDEAVKPDQVEQFHKSLESKNFDQLPLTKVSNQENFETDELDTIRPYDSGFADNEHSLELDSFVQTELFHHVRKTYNFEGEYIPEKEKQAKAANVDKTHFPRTKLVEPFNIKQGPPLKYYPDRTVTQDEGTYIPESEIKEGEFIPEKEAALRLRDQFAGLTKQEKRKYYTCGNQYLIHEQIPHWQETSQKQGTWTGDVKGMYEPDAKINQKVALWKGDITHLEVDAIVNSASSLLTDTREGVNKHICDAAGPLLDYELNVLSTVYVGEVAVSAGYALPAKYIFHTSGPPTYWKDSAEQLKTCYLTSLNEMKDMGLKTLVPSRSHQKSSGRKTINVAPVYCQTCIKRPLKRRTTRGPRGSVDALLANMALITSMKRVDKVIFCVYDDVNWHIYREIMPQIFPPAADTDEVIPSTSLPVEILRMDQKSIDLYKQALTEGKEAVHNIRVMVVGHYGVGKTALTRRLLGKNVEITERESTNGIEVHVRRCKVSLQDGHWTVLKKDEKSENTFKRLAKLLALQKAPEGKESQLVPAGLDVVDGNDGNSDVTDAVKGVESHTQARDSSDEDMVIKPIADQDFDVEEEKKADNTIVDEEQTILKDLKELILEANRSNLQEEKDCAALSIWDFAGQSAFYSTHQVFLSSRAVYLLVTDISKHINDVVMEDECFFDSGGSKACKISEFVEFWLNSIHGYCPSTQTGVPPVILIGTHADQLGKKDELSQAYFFAMRNFLSDKVTQYHLADEDFAVDNTIVDPTLDALKSKILEVASQQDYWGELIPARWITLEKALMELKDKGLKIIKTSDIDDINRAMPVTLSTKQELQLFLRFQHDLGNILYFSDDALEDNVLLDPQWLVDAFKCLITAKMFCCKKPHVYQKWQEFNNRAILKWDLIDAVWKKEENESFYTHRHHLIGLLERLDIIAKPRTFNDDKTNTKVQDYFFAPCVLKDPPPPNILTPCQSTDSMSTTKLCFTVSTRFIPTAIFNRLFAACLARWPISRQSKKELIYCGCGIFDVDATHRLALYFSDNVIQLWITKYGRKDPHPSSTVCANVREFVEQTLRRIKGLVCQLSELEIFIKCPNVGVEDSGLLKLNDLLDVEEIPCHCHDNTHVLDTSELLRFWYKETASKIGHGGMRL